MAALNTSLNDLLQDDLTLAVLEADNLSSAQFRETLEAAARRIGRRAERQTRASPRRFAAGRDIGFSLACCGA